MYIHHNFQGKSDFLYLLSKNDYVNEYTLQILKLNIGEYILELNLFINTKPVK